MAGPDGAGVMTVSSSPTAGPDGGVPEAVAVFVKLPASTSAWVTR